MSKTRQLALPLETHRNHYLFSDHFLNQVLPGQGIWRESEAEARQALDAIAELYSRLEDALPHYNEAALEQEWIRPILDVLGHVYHVQPSLTGAAGTPDYAFFADDPAKQVATPMWGTPAFWETALAVGDAKRWDRPLDKRIVNGAPDAFTNANPCYQIDYYLRRTGCAWGVVSNGRRWRLYHRDTSVLLDHFYEVDLVQLIEQGDLAAFRYFYLFFRAVAFRPDAEGRCWLDEVLAQSAAYAVRVGDELKGRVYEALRLLAQGFLDYPVDDPDQALDPTTDLSPVHDACLILLYRLLFLLYAESRGLLPLDNPSYAGQYSLKAIKEDIAHKTDAGVVYLAKKATLWDDLRTLFEIIYSGQEPLGVPAYDGRLFDPARYPFLEERTIGDKYLAQAIDLLARAEAEPGQGLSFVDYRDLSIRHLGSIYEGLLEYRLAYATEEMAIVKLGKRDKKEEIVPSSEAGEGKVVERIPAGQVYLVTDRGERKATGSYYTPDYIVKYIVEQTLGPLADSQAEAVKAEVAALKAKNKGGARRTQAYKDELTRLQNSFADRILDLNTLDPAMGSGHFLVEATDYLARRIVEAGVATEALANGDEESELSYWRRRVVERCIYGVDLNPLAVELAKLSLWLATVAKGKPLSFLDHHLRCGNSLIGARVADLQALPVRKKRRKKETEAQQLAMWDESAFTQDMYLVVGAMRQIQEYETTDLVSVKEKERLFEETVEQERRKWSAVADLWTAAYFGLELTPELYNACVQYTQGKPVLLQAAQAEAVLDQAHGIWEDKRFFHWEIEFPEVFFDEYGQHKGDAAGFDAVIGNPPYVRQEQVSSTKPYLAHAHSAVYSGVADLYVYFYHQGLELLRVGSRMSYIVTNKWLRASYGEPLRAHFSHLAEIEQIVDFGHAPIFEDVDTFPCIIVLRKPEPERKVDEEAQTKICLFPREVLGQVELPNYVRQHSYSVPMGRFSDRPWSLERAEVDDLMAKIRRNGVSLAEFAGEKPYRGVVTGLNRAFLIDTPTKERLVCEDPRSAEIVKPYLRGQDIERWMPRWAGLWMVFTRRGIDIGDYPAIKQHLVQFREELEPRPKDWKGRKWPGRKPGFYQWYEIQDTIAYWELFTEPKILYQEIQFHSWFALDTQGYFSNNKVFLIPAEDPYLLAVLNSPLMWWYNWRYLPHMKDEALSPKGELMGTLPIASPSDAIRAEVEPTVEWLIALAKERREATNEVLEWLRMEFSVRKPGQRLETFSALNEDAFIKEVKRRGPRAASRLSPASLRSLREVYAEHTPHIRDLETENQRLEQRLATLVNAAYDLTPEEVDLLWQTAPPRMPVGQPARKSQ